MSPVFVPAGDLDVPAGFSKTGDTLLIGLNIFTMMAHAGIPFLAFIPLMVMGPNFSVPVNGAKTMEYQVKKPSKRTIKPIRGIKPVLTFIPLMGPNISVPANGTKTMKYKITNLSTRTHKLILKPIRGIRQVSTAGNCPSPFTLRYRQSCTLTLQINGNVLRGNIVGGPTVCQQGTLRCHQPNHGNRLNIKLAKAVIKAVPKYTLGGTVTGLTGGTVALQVNGTNATPIRVNGRFTFSTPIIQGRTYAVTVKTHPQNQTCKITRGSGTINRARVAHVLVSCSRKTLPTGNSAVIKPATESTANSKTAINTGNELTELSPLAPSNTGEPAVETQQEGQADVGAMATSTKLAEGAMTLRDNDAVDTDSAIAGSIPIAAQDNSDRAIAQSQPGEQASVTILRAVTN